MDKQAQLRQIRAWVDTGESRMQTIMRVCDAWGMDFASASVLVQMALKDVVDLLGSVEKQEFLAQQMSRLEALAIRAQEEGNLNVALSCYKELHQLAGLLAR